MANANNPIVKIAIRSTSDRKTIWVLGGQTIGIIKEHMLPNQLALQSWASFDLQAKVKI